MSWVNDGKPKRYSARIGNYTSTKGRVGEVILGMCLDDVKTRVPIRYFSDVVIQTRCGGDTQIDFILLSKKGFFVIENKNWDCVLHCGEEDDKSWSANYHGRPQTVLNPIKQNQWHLNRLKMVTGSKYESLIVLNCDSGIDGKEYPNIIKVNELENYLLKMPDIYTEEEYKEESRRIYELIIESGW